MGKKGTIFNLNIFTSLKFRAITFPNPVQWTIKKPTNWGKKVSTAHKNSVHSLRNLQPSLALYGTYKKTAPSLHNANIDHLY